MIPVEMGDKDDSNLHEGEGRDHDLSLGSLPAVHEYYVGAVPHRYAGGRFVPRGDAGPGAEEEQLQHVTFKKSIVDRSDLSFGLRLLLVLLVVLFAEMHLAEVVALEDELRLRDLFDVE